ncbi:WHG domain-containing protein [Nocardia vinacea]|uniref:WHG domain-containing protein n=1 Tax=Nocardia vinacea TaxID=96468 RepID=A0ABZ1YPN9_9NOCA|nr:WHG domain-containing protein [Nocardia vinacea]
MPKPSKEAATRLTPDQIVERLVEAATRLLAEKGPSQIKARSVAEAAQVSTMAVYYHLGGVPELLRAVVEQGFRDLGRTLVAVPPSEDPVTDLFAMALAYRGFAQDNPHLYDAMFGLSTRGSYRALETSNSGAIRRSKEFQSDYAHLVETCARLVRSGRVRSDEDPDAIATQLWSCVHGFITLELGGSFTHVPDPVRLILQPMTVNLLVGLGDTAASANASETAASRSLSIDSN